MKLFVDTSAWVAAYYTGDQWHASAHESFAAIVSDTLAFVTTDYVVDESLTLLLQRAGRSRAVAFGEAVQNSARVELVRIDAVVWEEAWRMFRGYGDKKWSFTDCTSFVVMRQLGLTEAFTFDRHFVQAGFRLWPELPRRVAEAPEAYATVPPSPTG